MNQEIVTKKCNNCQETKPISNFSIRSDTNKLRCTCKDCVSNTHRKYYTNNRTKILNRQKEQHKHNPQKHRDIYKKYYVNNKERVNNINNTFRLNNKEWFNQYWVNRRNVNIHTKILHVLRSRLNHALKRTIKHKSTIELCGCDINTLKLFLESKFKLGMSWENHGFGTNKWHIDHILPCASFDLSDPEQQKKCFHYTNLQPLWQQENFKKSDSIIN